MCCERHIGFEPKTLSSPAVNPADAILKVPEAIRKDHRDDLQATSMSENQPVNNPQYGQDTIFNFNKLVSDLDIHANTPKS